MKQLWTETSFEIEGNWGEFKKKEKTIKVAFILLKILVVGKANSWMRFPKVISKREENYRVTNEIISKEYDWRTKKCDDIYIF